MNELVSLIGEYFFGTETNKIYREERNFYREHETDSAKLTALLRNSESIQACSLIGRNLANLFSFGSIVASLKTGDNSYLLYSFLSEVILRIPTINQTSGYLRRSEINRNKYELSEKFDERFNIS